ncbi:MAG: hypothetical protein KGN01_07845 [Patescibacteria group bacterium]|nr:hypothetical protein [Patescibacteria group bacterium]
MIVRRKHERTGDGFLDFRKDSHKYRIFRYCYHRKGQWIHNGELQREAMNSDAKAEGSTIKRRIKEMTNDKYLKEEVRMENGKRPLYIKYE